jgi:CSLREA domain-containing protein
MAARRGEGRAYLFRAMLFALCACLLAPDYAGAKTFMVNSPADVRDVNPGDGVCETAAGNHICTLRAAVEEANKSPGADAITLEPDVTYVLSLTETLGNETSDLIISDSVSITGAGPGSTIIDGNGAVTRKRVFYVLKCVGGIYKSNGIDCEINGDMSVSMSGIAIMNGFATYVSGHGDDGSGGGGILNVGTLTLNNVAVTDNTASGLNDWGGGIYNAGPLTMTNCVIANNTTGAHNAYGGGMYNQGAMAMTNCTISGNKTYGGASSPGYGGGVFNIGSATTIRNSTISDNRATVGGGIYHGGYPLALINDTISGNSSDGNGGGLHNNSGTTGLFNVTVTQNLANADDSGAGIGGGISNGSGTLTVINSIIARNTVVIPTLPYPTLDLDECAGTITSQGYDIFEFVNADNCTVNGPYGIDDPQLGSLQFNGGPTQTHAIFPGSPALDMGNPAGCTDDLGAPITTDQRGVHRPHGPVCDIGAFESDDIIFRNGFEPAT